MSSHNIYKCFVKFPFCCRVCPGNFATQCIHLKKGKGHLLYVCLWRHQHIIRRSRVVNAEHVLVPETLTLCTRRTWNSRVLSLYSHPKKPLNLHNYWNHPKRLAWYIVNVYRMLTLNKTMTKTIYVTPYINISSCCIAYQTKSWSSFYKHGSTLISELINYTV